MNLELVKDVVSHNDNLILKLQPALTGALIVFVIYCIIGAIGIVLVHRFINGKANMKKAGAIGLLMILSIMFLFIIIAKRDLPISKAILYPGYSQGVATYEGYIDKKDINVKELNTSDYSKKVIYVNNQSIPKNTKEIITTDDIDFNIEKADKIKIIAKVEYAYAKNEENSKKAVNLDDLKHKNDLNSEKMSKHLEQLKSVKLESIK